MHVCAGRHPFPVQDTRGGWCSPRKAYTLAGPTVGVKPSVHICTHTVAHATPHAMRAAARCTACLNQTCNSLSCSALAIHENYGKRMPVGRKPLLPARIVLP